MSELALVCRTVAVDAARRSPGAVRDRLRALADRIPRVPFDADPYALAMARLGLEGPAPAERVLRERLVRGGYRSRGVVADALLIALVETGVPVWATDDPGPLRLEGADVVGTSLRVPVFTAPPRVSSSPVTVFGLVVPGVALGVVEEAVWIAADIVAA